MKAAFAAYDAFLFAERRSDECALTFQSADFQAAWGWVRDTLTPREVQVMEMRYGARQARLVSLRLVGEARGVTQERIRQVEHKALRKLKHPDRRLRIVSQRCYLAAIDDLLSRSRLLSLREQAYLASLTDVMAPHDNPNEY